MEIFPSLATAQVQAGSNLAFQQGYSAVLAHELGPVHATR